MPTAVRVQLKCPRCGTLVAAVPGRIANCHGCGYAAYAPGPRLVAVPDVPQGYPPPNPLGPTSEFEAPPRPGPVRARPPAPITRNRIVGGLVLNVLLPGAGTILAGRRVEGWIQLALFALGLATIIYLVGLAVAPAVWVWAVVGSIQQLVEKPEVRPPAPAT